MSKPRVAVAGASSRGAWFARHLHGRGLAEVVGICDPYVRKAEWIAEEHDLAGCRCFDHVERMLDGVECDAVLVTASDAHHAACAVPALERGKFVFCEKPLETTLDQCRAIVDADERAGGKTFVGLNLRYAPVYETVKAQIDAGAVGDVLTIQADEFYDGGRSYFRRWNRLRSEGGGLWITKACHDFDLLHWFAAAAPLEVSAMAEKTYYVPKPGAAIQCRDCDLASTCPDRAPEPPRPLRRITEESGGPPGDLCLYNSDSDTFDHGIAAVRFERDILATYTCNVVAGFSNRRIRVSGTRGTLDGSLRDDVLILRKRDPGETVEVPIGQDVDSGHGGADEFVLESFIAFVNGEAEPRCRPREAAVAVALGLAATESSDTHRVVDLAGYALGPSAPGGFTHS